MCFAFFWGVVCDTFCWVVVVGVVVAVGGAGGGVAFQVSLVVARSFVRPLLNIASPTSLRFLGVILIRRGFRRCTGNLGASA